MKLARFTSFSLFVLLILFSFSSCQKEAEKGLRGLQSEEFYERYNKYIVEWLAREKAAFEQDYEAKEAELAKANGAVESKAIKDGLAELKRNIERLEFRQSLGDFFSIREPEMLPAGLKWENGMEEPDIGDPAAKKGGVFRYYWASFPPTIRQFGSNSSSGYRGEFYDLIQVNLVELHPVTKKIIPGIAKEWAESEDGRTVYFRIHPDAKFNDGHPIVAEDYFTWARLRLSDHVDSIFFKQAIREQFGQFVSYGPDVIAITLPEPKPLLPWECGEIPAAATHFYDDFGPDFEEKFQWVVPPTTAPYRMHAEDLVKGESVTLTRVDDWWLKDRKFFRNRFNADKLVYRVVRDPSKAWELFRAGELDYFPITLPNYYYEKSEIPAVFNGYIERTTWYNQYPRPPWSLFFNTAEAPLDNPKIRRGIAYASNWEKVIDTVFQGDATRLPGFIAGYGELANPKVSARPFSIGKARELFAEAGYNIEDNDGILMNENGQRLDIEITVASIPEWTQRIVILKEEARKAGLNLVLDVRDLTASYQHAGDKECQMFFGAWSFRPPYPRFYEFLHSRNAYDEKGNRKTDTNNIFSYANDEMDSLTESYRNASNLEELKEYGYRIQEIMAEEDLLVPGYMNEFSRVANWRWVRWPDVEETRFAPPLSYIPMESYCYWIDEEMKKETLDAKMKGLTFPEVERIVDDYRTKPTASKENREGGVEE